MKINIGEYGKHFHFHILLWSFQIRMEDWLEIWIGYTDEGDGIHKFTIELGIWKLYIGLPQITLFLH